MFFDNVDNCGLDLLFCFPGVWQWESIDGSVCVPLLPPSISSFVHQFDLCVTGDGLARLSCDSRLLHTLLPHIRVFARVSPKQKVDSKSAVVLLLSPVRRTRKPTL